MWDLVIDLLINSVSSAFEWFNKILASATGAWDTIFTLFVIVILSRFMLGPLLGVAFGGRSDKAKKSGDKHE